MSEPTLKPDQPPVPPATPFTSFGPVILTLPWRPVPMQMRVAFPATGGRLPILLLSHGHGASPGSKCLLTLPGAGHLFGGISGCDAKETSDESPERVAALQRITWACLRTRLYPEDPAWHIVRDKLNAADPTGHIECR